MKREFLKELGLTDEQVDKVMTENGKDIEKAKGDLAAKETELEEVKGQLEAANKQIEEFREMDIESIKQAAEEYKEKFEQAEIDAQEKLEALQFEHNLERQIVAAKAKNVKAVKALLDIDTLRKSKNQSEDIKAAIKAVQKDNDYLFGESGKPNIFAGGNPNGGSVDKNPFSKEYFNLTEQGKLLRENPELAKQLQAAANKS